MSKKGTIMFGDGENANIELAWDSTGATKSSTIDSTIPEQWSTELEEYVKPKLFMEKFVVVKTDLIRQKGDTVHVHKLNELTWGEGSLAEGTSLEGNETPISLSQVNFVPTKKTRGVAFTEEAEALSIVEMRSTARTLLGDWAAKKKEKDLFAAMATGVQTSGNIVYGGNATSVWDIDSGDTMTPELISKLKYRLEVADIPKFDAGDPKDPSAKNEGYYVVVLHPYQIYDLTQTTTYKDAANQAATVAAMNAVGPMFRGFDAYWDGCLIYRSSLASWAVPGGGYSNKIAKGFMFGPRFVARAVGIFQKGPGYIWKEKVIGYDEGVGIGIRFYDQVKVLNDDRLYGIYTFATNLAA